VSDWVKPESGGSGDREFFNLKSNEGALLGIKVRRFQEDYENNFKEIKDTVFADVTVFDGANAGKSYDNVDLQYTAFVNILKDKEGLKVLGRAVKVKNKYWNLEDPTDEDFALASAGAAKVETKIAGPFG